MNDKNLIPSFNSHTLDALWKLQKIILGTPDFTDVVSKVVNSILTELGYLQLGYRILVLTLLDKKTNTIKRIAISRTPEATKAQEVSPISFERIEIPLSADDNFLVRCLKDKKIYATNSWPDIFRPVLSDESALHNQESAGIKTSMLYPIIVNDESIGVMIFSMVKNEDQVSVEEKFLIERFTDIVGLAVQNSLLYSSVKETAAELKSANSRLQEVDKLKDEFVSLASHELRTPMTAVRSYLSMISDPQFGGALNAQQQEYLTNATLSVNRLIQLVNDMLNISRIESGRLVLSVKAVDINQLVNEVKAEVLPRMNELGVHLVINANPNLPQVIADIDKIKEVLVNLVGNSMKFTPKGGTVTISYVQKNDMVEITVADTGCGIDADDLPKLFQKFNKISNSQTANQPSGTGLGLYLSKALIELHKGKIWATSAGVGKGSEFTFSLKVFNEKDLQEFQAKYAKASAEASDIIHTQV